MCFRGVQYPPCSYIQAKFNNSFEMRMKCTQNGDSNGSKAQLKLEGAGRALQARGAQSGCTGCVVLRAALCPLPKPSPPLPGKLSPYRRCQNRKCPILRLDKALSNKNLVNSQSKYDSYFRTWTNCKRYWNKSSSLPDKSKMSHSPPVHLPTGHTRLKRSPLPT